MEERAKGLILRTRPLTETSLIVHWLTADAGRIATVAKGARRPKSAFRGKLDLFFMADFTFARSRRSELHTLREVRLTETHAPLRRDLDLLQQAAYAAGFVERATERETPVPEVFDLMRGFLGALADHPWRMDSVLWFELKLLAALGMQPDVDEARVSQRTRSLMREVLVGDWNAAFQTAPDPGQVKEFVHFLHGFLIYHFDRLPAGRSAALKQETAV
ncbi:MAG TPA: DNA repair protein RecO [Verrucomicrobiales bacterium]|nr:DNA repair protein RecO [Verrucomicrobiales bacterium]